MNRENPTRSIKLEKVTVNIGCGGDAESIERAEKLLEMLSGGRKPYVTKSKRRSTFGVTKGKPVGVKLTMRGKQATEFLKMSLAAVDNKIKGSQFDEEGNFSFGVKEYIELPGVKYKHDIGMFGFDVSATLQRAGFSVARRKVQTSQIPKSHKITKEESMQWLAKNFGANIA